MEGHGHDWFDRMCQWLSRKIKAPGRDKKGRCTMKLILTFILFGVYARSAGSPQRQPTSYADPNIRQQVSKQAFVDFVHANRHLNQHIPSSPPSGGMRVVTFNLHYFRDVFDKNSTLQNILRDVKDMNADVYLFQEVHMDTSKPDRKAFDAGLSSLGYKWQHVQAAPGATLGQMIASKYPLGKLRSLDLGYKRIMIEAELALKNNDKLTLFAAHWQNADVKAREKQARLTVGHIKKKGGLSMGKFVLGADFNATWQGEAIQTLATSGLMKTSYSVLKWPHPHVTCWSGRAIDFVWAGNEVSKHVDGTYVYYTLSSDHLPIIMDLSLQPDAYAGSSVGIISWVLVAVAIIGTGIGLVLFIRSRHAEGK